MSEHVTTPTSLTYNAISAYAERAGQHYELFRDGERADIDRLIAELGGSSELSEGHESLHVEKLGDFTVFIPTTTSGRRDRFTKAHELGHYFLHYFLAKETEPKTFARGGRNVAETEANVFASSLLMPSDLFREAWKKYGSAIPVARVFDVSPAAARVRAQVLNLS